MKQAQGIDAAKRAALIGKLATQQLQLGPNRAETREIANKTTK
ncbi:MAG: hypothetical protein OES25_16885 [Acidobacteriota bacterium]|nr:hypothetical protein [Acidobacteriota bacterium]